MSDILRSVGLDVGTTSTQMIFSELTVENKASGFAVPEMEIARRDIRYRSPVYFTPLLDESHVDAGALRELVAEEYRKAGIRRESVDTGAIIITGETSRKENARAVLDACRTLPGSSWWPPLAPIWKAYWPPRARGRWTTPSGREKRCCTWTSAAAPAIWR